MYHYRECCGSQPETIHNLHFGGLKIIKIFRLLYGIINLKPVVSKLLLAN